MTFTKWLVGGALCGAWLCAGMSLLLTPVNPMVKKNGLVMPADVHAIVQRSCFDCHSNETRWPWYSKVWPVSKLIESDVLKARATMNFSEWQPEHRAARGLLMASCAAVKEGLMPKPRYLALHRDARLTEGEKRRFCEWTREETAHMRAAKP